MHTNTMANVYEMSTQSKVASRVKNIFRLLDIPSANLFTLWPVFTCAVKFSLHFCFLFLHFSCKIVMIHFILALCTPSLCGAMLCMFSCCDSSDAAATIVFLEHIKIILIYRVRSIMKVYLLFTILFG